VPRTFPLIVLLALALPAHAQPREREAETYFELKVRPVLAGTCFRCHGGKKVSHGLRVDSREALLRGGQAGPPIVPGDPDRSLLIRAVRYAHGAPHMPPDRPLSAQQVADLAAWVKQGAVWPPGTRTDWKVKGTSHWAFEPVRRAEPPPDPTGWSANRIDRFIRARQVREGLQPVPPADRRTLLRRVYFDLIGLPPPPDAIVAFLADDSPDAFARVVDRLLASPQYGERWGRHWLDVARYADTAGDNADYPVPEAYRYRDYVIAAFNADKPYDRFVREQIAGDILARQGPRETYAKRVIATGFLALSRRYATGPYELWPLTLEDAIDTTGRAFLGLTLRCARCHDHKFDPVTQADYYALYGIFASTQFPWAGAEELASKQLPREHFVALLPPDEAGPRLAAYRQRVQELETALRDATSNGPWGKRVSALDRQMEAKSRQVRACEARKEPTASLRADLAALRRERDAANGQLQAQLNRLRDALRNLLRPGLPSDLPGAYAVSEGKPVNVPIQLRGEVERPGPVVRRDVPEFLRGGAASHIPGDSSGRLQLARWLTRPDNPLTARVMVNRIWQHHFGKGIVGTPSNFGTRGEPPTHPQLLDWLAARFVESGWSVKAMHRLILSSKTYQLSGAPDDADAARDPANRWYWRYDRRRLDAEAIRDALLTVSGGLDLTRPGPHPFPPMDRWGWTQHNPFKDVYPSRHRSVYLMAQRFQRQPFLALFDGPDTNTTTDRRTTSTVPQQALFLMNNPFVSEQARGFARRLLTAAPAQAQRMELAHAWAWSRPPRPAELELGRRYLDSYGRALARAGVAGAEGELEAWTSYCRVLLCANEFVYLD
jgi:hypothetical protein